jgi:hypothetical protein
MGIEPTLSAWEAEVLPLNYTRICDFDGYFMLFISEVNYPVSTQKNSPPKRADSIHPLRLHFSTWSYQYRHRCPQR